MKLAIITPTCREDGRLREMSRTIAAAMAHAADGQTQLKWFIVDEKRRDPEQLIDMSLNLDAEVIFPLPSKHRNGTSEKAPAHNAARGAGLSRALEIDADYIALLNDCNVITYGAISVIRDCFKQGLGYRARMHEVADMAIPADGKIAYKDHHDLLRPIPTKTACGALWGAPAAAFRECRGFDRSYDGERYGNDLDMVIRLNRVGVNFVTTERAFVIQLRRTKTSQEISTRKDVVKGVRNRALINQLIREHKRITPLWSCFDPEPTPVEVAKPAAAAAPSDEAPKRTWKKRAPPVVGGRRLQPTQKKFTPAKPGEVEPAAPRALSNSDSGVAPLPPAPPAGPDPLPPAPVIVPTTEKIDTAGIPSFSDVKHFNDRANEMPGAEKFKPAVAPHGNADDPDLSNIDQIDDTPPADELDEAFDDGDLGGLS